MLRNMTDQCISGGIQRDGVGFDEQIIGRDTGSLGLLGMRERAAQFGGTFQIRSNPGKGTRIRIEIPYAEESIVE